MPVIINIHRNSKRKSFTFWKTIDSLVEFTKLYYRPSIFCWERTFNSYRVSASLPIPCAGQNSVSAALCGVSKRRLLQTAEKAAVALWRWFIGKVQSGSLTRKRFSTCSTWSFRNTSSCTLVFLVPKALNLQTDPGLKRYHQHDSIRCVTITDTPWGQVSQV